MISVLALQELQLPESTGTDAEMMWSTWSRCCNGSTQSVDNCCGLPDET